MKLLALAVAVAVIFPLSAEAAEGWGLIDEEAVRFESTVVDIRCELTGDFPAACGGATRQLGLVTDEGKMIMAHKNFVPFAGGAVEMAPFCGKRVVADGLFATNRGVTVFVLQFIRQAPDGK